MSGLGIPIVIVLLLANAIFVAAEFALVTVRRSRVDQLAAEGHRPAQSVKRALGNLDYYIAASQLGITMASIALGFVGEPALAAIIEPPVESLVGSFAPALSHTIAIAVAFTFVTSLHIIIGEFVPKSIALEKPEQTSYFIARPLGWFVRIFGPVISLMNTIGNGGLRMLGVDVRPLGEGPLTAEDLAYSVETSASAGLISRREMTLSRHLLQLSELECRALMVPRNEIVGLDISSSWEEVADTFANRPLTRYPVYERDLDHIVGILDARRLLLSMDTDSSRDWQAQVRPAIHLPETQPVQAALDAIQRSHYPMVILVDEYGGTAGLITQFDIVRYLSSDAPDTLGPNGAGGDRTDLLAQEVSGQLPLSEVEAWLDIELPDTETVTLGGLVTELHKRLPREGDEIHVGSYIFRVLQIDGRRISRIQILQAERGSVTAKSSEERS